MTVASHLSDSPPVRDRRALLFRTAGLLVATLAAVYGLSRSDTDPDLWGHTQFGRDALLYGIPESTTYSYTAEGHPWINHELLAEYGLALLDNIGRHGQGLLAFKCLLGVLVVGVVLGRAERQGARMLVSGLLALLAAALLAPYWAVRPQLFSYAYFVGVLWLLSAAFRQWEDGGLHVASGTQSLPEIKTVWLWLLAPVMCLWANSHGAFLAGWGVAWTYLALRVAQAWQVSPRAAWRTAVRVGPPAVIAGFATLLNPYGPELHVWLLSALSVPRPEITEWHPPELLQLGSVPFWIMVSVWLGCLVFARRRFDLTHQLLLVLLLWQACTHERHVAFLALAFLFWMPGSLEQLWSRLADGAEQPDERPHSAWLGGAVVSLAVLGVLLSHQLCVMRVSRARYPVSAVAFMSDHALAGRTVVTYNWAEYVLAACGARSSSDAGSLVAFDGRFRTCYPQSVVDMHFDLVLGNDPRLRHRDERSGPFRADRILDFAAPELVLISRRQTPSVRVLEQRADWVLLYQDELAQLWGRANIFDDPAGPDYFPVARRRIGDATQDGWVAWPALPGGSDDGGHAGWRTPTRRGAET